MATPGADKAGIPYCSDEHILHLKKEYEHKTISESDPALEACFNYSWALVHSHRPQHVKRGLELVAALMSADPKERRELLYLKSVGQYRLKYNLEARETLKNLLEEFPEFRQAESLLETVENEIVKEGLIGVGVGAAVVGVLGALAVSAMRKR